MISKHTIDKVYETSRVEEVISDFVNLKKSGTNLKGLSPFTNEKTPSFMVSPVKQIWKDFSSGKGGNSVAFLMEHERFSYPEAIKYLAKKYNIEIEETFKSKEQKEKISERESMYLVVQNAKEYYKNNLWKDKEGNSIGFSYVKERGFEDKVIRDFEIGYSLNNKDSYFKYAISEGFSRDFLEKTGMCIFKENKAIDRFRARVMFPIKNFSGRVLGFGGRILSEKFKAAKYINSPESDIYEKSKVLFGIYESKKTISNKDLCYLVEGYTDVIQMHQSGIENVVASSGTALTIDQISLIQRLTQNIVVLFDGDEAGLRASLRGLEMILEKGMNVKVCQFPEGKDPDSFSRDHSTEEILDFFDKNTKDFIQFKADLLFQESQTDPIKKADTIREIIEIIAKIPDQIKSELYIQECSKIMNISEEVLFNSLSQVKTKALYQENIKLRDSSKIKIIKSEKKSNEINQSFELEYQIINILLLYGDREEIFNEIILKKNDKGELIEEKVEFRTKVFEKIFLDLQEDEIEFTQNSFRELYKILINHFESKGSISIDDFTTKLSPELSHLVSDILIKDELYKLHDWEKKNIFVKERESNINQMVIETILTLRKNLIDKKINELQDSLKDSEKTNDDILSDVISYHQLKSVVSHKLNRVI